MLFRSVEYGLQADPLIFFGDNKLLTFRDMKAPVTEHKSGLVKDMLVNFKPFTFSMAQRSTGDPGSPEFSLGCGFQLNEFPRGKVYLHHLVHGNSSIDPCKSLSNHNQIFAGYFSTGMNKIVLRLPSTQDIVGQGEISCTTTPGSISKRNKLIFLYDNQLIIVTGNDI